MIYNNDKEVIFHLLSVYLSKDKMNYTQEQILKALNYDMGDYNFGKGDTPKLRQKIKDSVLFLHEKFKYTFDKNGNTQ